MYHKLFKYLVIILSFFSLSCSVELLNFKKENEKLHLELVLTNVRFNRDSLVLERVTTINESIPNKKIICDLSKDVVLEEKSIWSFLDFTKSNVGGIKYNYYSDYPVSYNNDSSFVLLIVNNIADNIDFPSALFLIDLNNCKSQKVIEINSPTNYISERIPFSTYINTDNFIEHNEIFLYFVGNPAKWTNRNHFSVCSNDTIFLFNIDDIHNPMKMMEARVNSNYQLIDSLIINQTTSNIELIDYKNKTKSILFDESFSVALNKSDEYIYFAQGWSLYRSPTNDIHNIQKIYKADNTIKDYIILNDEKFIIRCGDLTSIPEWDRFYFVDLKTNEISLFEKTSLLKSYDLTKDKKYFIIRKKIIQGSTYNVVCVFDLQNKRKYEFDDETFPQNN